MKYPGGRVITANITPHGETWMGQASKDEFIGRFHAWRGVSDVQAAKGRNTFNPFPDAAEEVAIAKE
jgi:hypothetical protein